jgi:hypothetical protein
MVRKMGGWQRKSVGNTTLEVRTLQTLRTIWFQSKQYGSERNLLGVLANDIDRVADNIDGIVSNMGYPHPIWHQD